MNITGTITEIKDRMEWNSGFSKREFILRIEEDSRYPQEIPLELHKDKCERLDEYKAGDRVTVSYDMRGREWNGRHFLNLVAWKIELDSRGGGDVKEEDYWPGRGNETDTDTDANTGSEEGPENEEIPF
jgi:hypothetical protein